MITMHYSKGFTVIEALITVIVASFFLLAITVLYTAVTRASATTRNRSDASDIAYAELRQYVYSGAKPPSGFTCNASNDLTSNVNAAGSPLTGNVTVPPSKTTLPQPVTYSVVALFPYGCSVAAAGAPLLIRSTVTYGASNLTITHAEYVGY